MGFLTRVNAFFFAFLLQNRNTFFSFFLKSFLILSEKSTPVLSLAMNNRDHRKIMDVDGSHGVHGRR